MAKSAHPDGSETEWATGRDLTDRTVVFEIEQFRRTLEDETRTYSGFRRRVRTEGVWSNLPMVFGVPILLFQLATLIWAFAGNPTGRADAAWQGFADSSAPAWAALGAALVAVSLASREVRRRREFRFFARDGWIALQATTGLTELGGDGAGMVVYDYRAVGGAEQFSVSDFGKPIVLVSTPGQPVDAFAAALGAVRAATIGRVFGREDLADLRSQVVTKGAAPADLWFADSAGCLVGPGNTAHLAAAIPRAGKSGRRVQLGRIRMRPDEARLFFGAVATPPTRATATELATPPGVSGDVAHASPAMTRRKKLLSVLLVVATLAVGPVMMVVGGTLVAAENHLLETGTQTPGTVTQVLEGAEASDNRFRVDFVSDDAADRFLWVSWSPSHKPSVGDEVTVVYEASDPGTSLVEGYDGDGITVLSLGVIFTLLFGVLGVIAATTYASGRAKRRRAASAP
jgi:hypothetical protein